MQQWSRSDGASLTQDELATTKRSYEDQLSMMSDHLCSMNETLTKQREEIDTLKLGSKVPKYCLCSRLSGKYFPGLFLGVFLSILAEK